MDLWEYMMFDRPVSITEQRSANTEDERASSACCEEERRERGDGKKAGMEEITEESCETPRRCGVC